MLKRDVKLQLTNIYTVRDVQAAGDCGVSSGRLQAAGERLMKSISVVSPAGVDSLTSPGSVILSSIVDDDGGVIDSRGGRTR